MARERSLKLIIRAQVDGARRALQETAKDAKKVGEASEEASKRSSSASERLVKSARTNEQAWTTAGTGVAAFGVASAAALGGSTKAAIDWESAWAGVTKTVDGSAAQMDALQEGLRGMARELPASHSEIAAVAEAAGQLGIQTPNILGFTQTMIDLGESTNLSADEAATALARFANVMGTSQSEFSNLGSAIVELGNNYATTEREIVEMSTRLAGAGRQAGLSEGEVLGLATALSSVGIEAEAGGTAFSRVLIEMGTAVDTQNEKLDTFARVAGMSSEQFRQAWGDDPGSAIAAFITGMGGMDAAGQSVQPVLEELGLTDIRVGDALRRSASAADLFTGAMETGNAAYAENTALSAEAAQRYETVSSRLSMAKNSIVDAGISLGEVFTPAIAAAADGLANTAGWLADLPGPMQALAAGAGAAASGVGLLGGGFLILTPKLVEAYDSFREIAGISPRLNSALGAMGKTVAAGGVLVGGLAVLGGTLGAIQRATKEAVPGVEAMTAALLDVADASNTAALDEIFAGMEIQANGISGMVEGPLTSFEDVLLRITDPSVVQRAESLDKAISFGQISTSGDDAAAAFARFDETLTSLVAGGQVDLAAESFDYYADRAAAAGVSSEEFAALLPGYGEAVQGVANEARLAGPAIEELAVAEAESAAAAEEAAAAQEELRKAYEGWLSEIGGASANFATVEGALAAHQEKTREWAEGQAEATESADDSWEDFYDGHTVNLEKYLGELESMVEAQANWQTNMESLVGKVSDTTLEHLARLGPEGAPLVAALADGSIEELARFDEAIASSGQGAGEAWAANLRAEAAVFEAAGAELGEKTAAQILQAIQSGEMTIEQAVSEYDLEAQLEVLANTDPAAAEVLAFVEDTRLTTARTKVDADASLAVGVASDWYFDTESMRPVSRMDANRDLADAKASAWEQYAQSRRPVPLLDANAGLARGVAAAWDAYARGLRPTAGLSADASSAYGTVSAWTAWARTQRVTIGVGSSIMQATGGPVIARASGGRVTGPGGPTDDLVPAWAGTQAYRLSDGEWITRASSVNYYGQSLMAAINEQRVDKMALLGAVKRADGGSVQEYHRTMTMPRYSTPAPSYSPAPAQPVPAPEPIDYDRLAAAMAGVQVHATASLDPRQVDQRISRFNSETSRGVRRP